MSYLEVSDWLSIDSTLPLPVSITNWKHVYKLHGIFTFTMDMKNIILLISVFTQHVCNLIIMDFISMRLNLGHLIYFKRLYSAKVNDRIVSQITKDYPDPHYLLSPLQYFDWDYPPSYTSSGTHTPTV